MAPKLVYTGQIESKGQLPTTAVIDKYPGPKSGSEAARLLDKGFALDQAGRPDRALEQYDLAHGALRRELHDALAPKLRERGADPDQLLSLPAHADPMVVGMLARSGLFAELPPALQETTLRYFNRAGLALKHQGAPDTAFVSFEMAAELRPNYGPALYNLANAVVAMQPPPGQADPTAQRSEALGYLRRAIDADSTFFSALAKKDPELNGLRTDAQFRELIGAR